MRHDIPPRKLWIARVLYVVGMIVGVAGAYHFANWLAYNAFSPEIKPFAAVAIVCFSLGGVIGGWVERRHAAKVAAQEARYQPQQDWHPEEERDQFRQQVLPPVGRE